ncbi:hypothetical protein JCM16303_002259 [Sporobolomyces ruberrimus]
MYPVLLRKQRITMPALPALFDCFEMTTTIDFVDVDGDFWEFEKWGFEEDQAFWHVRLGGSEQGIMVKVVFDQTFGLVGKCSKL